MPRSTKSPARSPAPEPIGGISDGRYITKDSHPVVTFPDCNQIDETRALSTCGASVALIVTLLAAVWWAPSASAWPAAHQVPATDRAETWDYRGAASLALDWLMLALLGLPVYLCKRVDRWFTDETAAERWGMNAYPIGKTPLRATAAMFFGLGAALVVYPLNYWALFLFTAAEGALLGVLCVMYYAAGYGDQILLAFGITMGIFAVLTLFTMQSRVDFAFLGPGLVALLFVFLFWSLFCFWLPGAAAFSSTKLISLFGALLFCGFIIYDTNMIMKYMGVDDYIIAAIELYLDIVNLFLFLLALLSGGRH